MYMYSGRSRSSRDQSHQSVKVASQLDVQVALELCHKNPGSIYYVATFVTFTIPVSYSVAEVHMPSS